MAKARGNAPNSTKHGYQRAALISAPTERRPLNLWDPDIVAVDPLFSQYSQPNSAITRLWTGMLWGEGPAWNARGRYLVWSDIPNNRQLRWLEENGQVSVFRAVELQQR